MKYIENLILNRAPETVRVIKSLCLNHFEHYENKDINFLFNEWKNSKLKSNTIKKLLTIYRAWYIFTHKEIPNLKYFNFNIDRTNDAEIEVWNKDEARKILDYSKIDDNIYTFLLIGLHTGARPGEILSLEWKNIDLENKKIFLIKSQNGGIKNGVKRSLKLSPELFDLLYRLNESNKNSESKLVKKFKINEFLKKACKDLKIKSLTAHKLRHTFATLALNSGVPAVQVAKLLGHKQVSTTINTYWKAQKEIDIDFIP